ncbi:MazG nucleotide pyrophosphohydrolase domain-containing protein [Pseudomonas sp. R16(2017)]|uniref:MazG nucleotide pyrophosphohydrolase domain-containing protein n=1 Tax=Pseudomonas sp. R16(2017) TaxID=1981704 RepID=UPI000A1DBDB5|nr:MazG nucleotide pyrophosphohydrolase domain-containing protein [Pseudomonas sp. R16(2017)]
MSKTLSELKEVQRNFDLEHTGNKKPFYIDIDEGNLQELEHLAVCLAGEVGEFCNILKKITRGDFSWNSSKAILSEELADIFIYLLKISNQTNIDIEEETIKKIKKNETRFQVKLK